MPPGEEQGKETQRGPSFIPPRLQQIAAVVVAALSIIVPTYFSLKSEHHKDIQIHFLAKLSMISPDLSVGERVKVSFEGRDIRNLTKLLTRITNTGDVPIAAGDIENGTLVLASKTTRILSAGITKRVPSNIIGRCDSDDLRVVLTLGLLNPQDSLECEVLYDGDPAWPDVDVRISGISKPTIVFPSDELAIPRVAFFDLSRPFEYTILVIWSIVSLALIATWGLWFVVGAKTLLGSEVPPSLEVRELLDRALQPERINEQLLGSVSPWLQKALKSAPVSSFAWIFDNAFLTQCIGEALHASGPVLPEKQVDELVREQIGVLRTQFREAVRQNLYLRLRVEPDATARNPVTEIPYDPSAPDAAQRFLEAAREAALTLSPPPPKPQPFKERLAASAWDIVAFVAVGVLAISLSLLVAGGWRWVYLSSG